MYETELLDLFSDVDAAKDFFACLDQQLNKVNRFYEMKETEFMERGESLIKQMNILLELKYAYKQKQQSKGGSSHSQDSNGDQSISCTFPSGKYSNSSSLK